MKDVRDIIQTACENIEGGKLSDGFLSLMNYLDTDTLVKWFVDDVCCGNVEDCLDGEELEAVNDWYNKHC